jgi:KaiC/GvpD/RAD55 family RecA-like ATPase
MPSRTASAREPTGVPGFDDLIEGGFPKGSITLISGSPGTGKSILSQQFIHTGATQYGQNCLYVSLEQRVPEIKAQAKRFGWDFTALEQANKVKFVFMDISERVLKEGETHVDIIKDHALDLQPQRVVIDSLVPLANFPLSAEELHHYGILTDLDRFTPIQIQQDLMTRMQIHKILMMLKDLKATSIVISEIPRESIWFSRDQVSEFMSDNVITLHYLGIGATSNRTIMIEKMRATKHSEDSNPMQITDKGIVIKKGEPYKI